MWNEQRNLLGTLGGFSTVLFKVGNPSCIPDWEFKSIWNFLYSNSIPNSIFESGNSIFQFPIHALWLQIPDYTFPIHELEWLIPYSKRLEYWNLLYYASWKQPALMEKWMKVRYFSYGIYVQFVNHSFATDGIRGNLQSVMTWRFQVQIQFDYNQVQVQLNESQSCIMA